MKSARAGWLMVVLLWVVSAGAAAWLDCWFMGWRGNRAKTVNPLEVYLGEGQKIFATHFYRKADVYYHSGMYPTIFDNTESFRTEHMAEDAGAAASRNTGDEEKFLGKPLDFIDRFSRAFFPSIHTHLDQGGAASAGHPSPDLSKGSAGQVREILPWLKVAQELDPDEPLTYTVAAYWLRRRMGQDREAEMFLREGLKHLPDNPALLFELGRVYAENRKDPQRARNIWLHASKVSQGRENTASDEEKFILQEIESRLAVLDENENNRAGAIEHWEQVEKLTPLPGPVAERIQRIRDGAALPIKAEPERESDTPDHD